MPYFVHHFDGDTNEPIVYGHSVSHHHTYFSVNCPEGSQVLVFPDAYFFPVISDIVALGKEPDANMAAGFTVVEDMEENLSNMEAMLASPPPIGTVNDGINVVWAMA